MSGKYPAALVRVLVVDDHRDSASLAETVLALEGFVARSVHDAVTAYEFARSARPDLILLDFAMPGVDGFELCRWIRADLLLAQTPLVLSSAYPIAAHAQLLRDYGIADFIPKPIDIPQLGPRVRRALGLRSQSSAGCGAQPHHGRRKS